MQRIYLKTAIAICLLFMLPISIYADAPAALSKLLTNFQSMQADFEQTVYDKNEKPLQKNTGSMALKRPGQFRWETRTPMHQLLITNGKHVWIYDVDLEQATQQPLDTSSSNPASLLSGSVNDLERRFAVSALKKPGKAQWFRLAPKDDSDMFRWIELGFTDGKLSMMRLNDKLGTLSVFRFSHVKINPKLEARSFTFVPPKGVSVIKN